MTPAGRETVTSTVTVTVTVETIAVYRANAGDPDRTAALDRDFLELLTTWDRADQPGRAVYEAEYLLVTARRAET